MPQFKPVRGMNDYMPEDAEKLLHVEQKARELAQLYGYEEVITPIVESYELLAAKAGEEIRLRMYQFNDMAGRKIALRAEFTPSIARLVATKMRTRPKPLKLFCTGSLYRYDEPQFGRSREFWQANYEIMGSSRPEADAEIVALTSNLLKALGLSDHYLKIGHMGILRGILNQEGIEEEQQNRIMQLLDKKQWAQSLTVAKELKVTNKCLQTLKALIEIRGKDCSRIIQEIKHTVKDHEGACDAAANLQEIVELTKDMHIECEIQIEAGFARGLEYYTGMIFESFVPEFERTGLALGGGGRYDRLIELFGGQSTPAVGVAQGMDRIVLAMKKQETPALLFSRKRVIIVPLRDDMRSKAYSLAASLRESGIATDIEMMGRNVAKVLSDADRRGFDYSVLVGPEEAKEGKVILRNMKKREQTLIETGRLAEEIIKA